MTEIEQLIKQAEAIKARRQPRVGPSVPSNLSWQELLDGKPYPHLRFVKL